MTDFTGNGRCTCGKEMEGGGGSHGGPLSATWRKCECGIGAMFYTVQKGYEIGVRAVNENQPLLDIQTRRKLEGVFDLAGLKVIKEWDIKNGYSGDKADWLLVKTKLGCITIGWRKRVIAIDWSDTGIKMIVKDDVTKDEYDCHAWSYGMAVNCLEQLVNASELIVTPTPSNGSLVRDRL